MNNELFTIKPNLKQFYGRTVTKEMEFDETTEIDDVYIGGRNKSTFR